MTDKVCKTCGVLLADFGGDEDSKLCAKCMKDSQESMYNALHGDAFSDLIDVSKKCVEYLSADHFSTTATQLITELEIAIAKAEGRE